jgi:hypothetical protein
MPHCKGWELFQLIPNPDRTVSLKTAHSTFVSAWDDDSLRQQPHLDAWEKFTVAGSQDATKVSLRSHHGKFLCAWDDKETTRQMPHCKDWEQFELLIVGEIAAADVVAVASPLIGQSHIFGAGEGGFGGAFFSPPGQDDRFFGIVDDEGRPYHGGCISGDAPVLLADGSTKLARRICVGDRLAGGLKGVAGEGRVVVGRTFADHAEAPHPVVVLNTPQGPFVITRNHPVLVGGRWVRPWALLDAASGDFRKTGQLAMSSFLYSCTDLHNFVTEPVGSIIVAGTEVSTLGQHCPGLDDGADAIATTSFYGSHMVISALRQHPEWPSVDLTR